MDIGISMSFTKQDHYFQNHNCLTNYHADCPYCCKHMVRQTMLHFSEGVSSIPNPHPQKCTCEQFRIEHHLPSG